MKYCRTLNEIVWNMCRVASEPSKTIDCRWPSWILLVPEAIMEQSITNRFKREIRDSLYYDSQEEN